MSSFLVTKRQIPPQPHHVLRRARLVDLLEQTIPQYKLTVVAAPAGYGKTTCLAQWASASAQRIVWFSIGEEDNDFERFFRYLVTGWEAVQPGVGESRLKLLLGATSPEREAVLAAFLNAANEIADSQATRPGKQLIFVLDDYHLIDDPVIHQALGYLLDHLPPSLHFVLAGRGEPPLPLARYRERGELLEVGAQELGFLPEESAAFLNEVMGLDLAQDEVAGLHSRLEGWIAGLQLVALSRRRHLGEAEAQTVSGRQRFIADYLSQDVLARVPEAERDFLLQTSLLARLCGSLCDAVTGRDDGQAMLEALERQSLFLVPLDDSRTWFRYHGLFADFLRQALAQRDPDAMAALHRRAAVWYLAHDEAEAAFRHALDAQDVELVVQIFSRYVNPKLMGGEFRLIKRWFDALPAEWVAAYPVLGLAQAGFLAFSGAFEACLRCLDEVEQRLTPAESEDRRQQLARVIAVRCFMACIENNLQQAERLAQRALHELPEEDFDFRPGIYAALGDTYRRNGRWEEARACYERALTFTRSPTVRVQSVHLYGALADLGLRQGRLHDAAGTWQKALASLQDRENWGRITLPVAGWVYIRLGEIEYEWNQVDAAREHLALGLERAELGGDVRTLIAGYLLGGRIALAAGDADAAAAYLAQAHPLVENAQFAEWTASFERLQLELWLAQERLRAAVQWADSLLAQNDLANRPESEVARLATARVLIVQGHAASLGRALALLEALAQSAEAEGREGILIEALALQALAHWRQGDRAAALTALERGLRLAEPEGYVRLFADLGLPMARILQEARARGVMPDYVAALLDAYGTAVAAEPPPLPEPLTPREQEVLERMAAGLTNREIGDELVISPETVKKHTANIYGKLGVSNRTEAVARARDLDLLD